ncbi:hypothetical protein ACFQPG_05195 [Sphingomonas sp. GCM10030256]|uniref:hypothetical protein n=1 Tax=Sphingomonas sp. GCM10030256 TaxID=3273427 RepID=UPI00360D3830
MYSQNDLDEAVSAGVLSADAATAFRAHIDRQRASPAVDEEQFRLITGFNDIFVSIAGAILLFAVGWIGQSIGQSSGLTIGRDGPSPISPAAVAAVAWGLALFFTAKRRMALPSILLLLAFVGGVFGTAALTIGLAVGGAFFDNNDSGVMVVLAVAAAVAAAGASLHWRRFRVPITVAAGAAAVAGILTSLLMAALGNDFEGQRNVLLATVLVLGVGVFLFAMRWDSSDRSRITRRSDVAFWLHLLAAPMIVHPVFTLLGLNDGRATIGEGLVVIVLYVVLAITALAVDRRALLVSALAYVLFALNELFRQFGAVELNVALTALVIGSGLLLLSAFWHQARAAIVDRLPGSLQDRLPTTHGQLAAVPA